MRNPVRTRRRLLAGAVLPLLLSLLVACQSSEDPADQSASAEQSTSASAEDTPSAETGSKADGKLDTRTFLPALKDAVKGNKSVHIAMDLDAAGQALTAEGDARFDDRNPAMDLTMSGDVFAGARVQMRLVGGLVYMSLPPMTPPGKFIKIDPKDSKDPLAAGIGDLTSQFDPLRTFDAFDAGLRKVKYVGEETVSGEKLDKYRVSVDFEAASKAQGQPAPPGLPKIVAYGISIDEENLMRVIEFHLGQQVSMRMTASRWGEPVKVTVPPAGKIAKRPPQLMRR
ncbi:MAG: LppX_LprAFG lipoprotein [Actinomycetota bacterium]|nr:LppX_LprAFG lipoprotein [Actinomycetota bacterium]